MMLLFKRGQVEARKARKARKAREKKKLKKVLAIRNGL